MGRHGIDCSGLEQGQVAVDFECGNEYLGYIKYGVFLDQLRNLSGRTLLVVVSGAYYHNK
jgi:hypothetical protein